MNSSALGYAFSHGADIWTPEGKATSVIANIDAHNAALEAAELDHWSTAPATFTAYVVTRPTSGHELQTFTTTEWEDSPSKVHKIGRVKKTEFDRWYQEKDVLKDATRWRGALKWLGRIAGGIALVVAGWLVRHYLGKP